MKATEKIIDDIVITYFDEPEKTLEEIFGEYTEDLTQEDADKVLRNLKAIVN